MKVRGAACTLVVLALLAAASAAVAQRNPLRPIAAGVLSDGDLVLLDRHHGLFRLSPGTKRLSRLRSNLGPWEPLDLTVVHARAGDQIWVTLRWTPSATRTLASLAHFDETGRRRGWWRANLPQVAGVAVDPGRNVAYLSALFESKIVSLDLSRPDSTWNRLVPVFSAEQLGPLTLDGRTGTLFAADPARGVVYRVRIADPGIEEIGRGLGFISAIALSPDGSELYVLDSSSGRVWGVGTVVGDQEPRLLFRVRNREDPLALAVSRTGTLWVGDAGTSELREYDRDGRPLRGFELIRP